MVKKKKERWNDLELVESVIVDPKTGDRIVTMRRGFVFRKTIHCNWESLYSKRGSLSARENIEKLRQALMDHLESKGIPTERTMTNSMVSVNGGPPRLREEVDEDKVFASGGSIAYCSWWSEGYKMAEPLTFEHECIEYLRWSFSILDEFNDVQLSLIEQYADTVARLDTLDGDMNLLACRGDKLTKSSEHARRAKSEKLGPADEVIKRHAKALWAKMPRFRQNANGTAVKILDGVNHEFNVIRERGESSPYSLGKEAVRKRVTKLIVGISGQSSN